MDFLTSKSGHVGVFLGSSNTKLLIWSLKTSVLLLLLVVRIQGTTASFGRVMGNFWLGSLHIHHGVLENFTYFLACSFCWESSILWDAKPEPVLECALGL